MKNVSFDQMQSLNNLIDRQSKIKDTALYIHIEALTMSLGKLAIIRSKANEFEEDWLMNTLLDEMSEAMTYTLVDLREILEEYQSLLKQ